MSIRDRSAKIRIFYIINCFHDNEPVFQRGVWQLQGCGMHCWSLGVLRLRLAVRCGITVHSKDNIIPYLAKENVGWATSCRSRTDAQQARRELLLQRTDARPVPMALALESGTSGRPEPSIHQQGLKVEAVSMALHVHTFLTFHHRDNQTPLWRS